jgi:hypothetical protein
MDQRVLVCRDFACGISRERLLHCDPRRIQLCARVRRGADDDAVVIVRESLGLHEALTAPRRTAIPVRLARRAAVERFDGALCSDGHFVDSTPRIIDELFRMSEGKASSRTGVTGVGRGCGVAASERVVQRRITDDAGPPAISHSLELAIPAGDRHPDFDFDIRIRCRRQRGGHAAESNGVAESLLSVGPAGGRTREAARGDDLGERNRRVLQPQRRERLTGLCRERLVGGCDGDRRKSARRGDADAALHGSSVDFGAIFAQHTSIRRVHISQTHADR